MTTKLFGLTVLGLAVGTVAYAQLSHGQFVEENVVKQQIQRNFHRGQQNVMKRNNMRSIIEQGNFASFQELSLDKPIGEFVQTEEQFSKLQEMHTAMQNGDQARAGEIREELGLPDKSMMRRGRGFRNGQGIGNNNSGGQGCHSQLNQ